MSNLILNANEVARWFNDNGDYTHNINYDLNENSIVMDLGGYTGVWAQQMIDKYNPNMYILEPITEFHDIMVDKFKSNDKVRLMNSGVGTENKDGLIYLSNDGTSSNIQSSASVNVNFKTIESILKEFEIDKVDLIQINIEGDEYPILEQLIENKLINKFENIQIQFHNGIENDIQRRENIRQGLIDNNFKNKFDYPFVWESWYKIK